MFKKIICFLMLLIPWFVSSILFPFDAGFYNSLYLPKITPPKFIFVIIWPILFTLITITLYRILKKIILIMTTFIFLSWTSLV